MQRKKKKTITPWRIIPRGKKDLNEKRDMACS